MRIAVVTESFLPSINGVTNSILHVLDHAKRCGHEAIVIAPGARKFEEEIPEYAGFPVYRVPTVMVPLIDSLPVGVPGPSVAAQLREFNPDVVHVASPFVLGAAGAFAAKHLRIPAVAIFQTDVAGFATRYHLSPLVAATWEWTRTIHNSCQRTLAPSTPTVEVLRTHGIKDVHRWGRGVDTQLFSPGNRSDALRREWDPEGTRKIIGYVGRLAAEKGVHRLAPLAAEPQYKVVIVGDGPERSELEALLPGAHFVGQLRGRELAAAYASFDLFVHPGEFETFCQTIQEAQASGVPTIAPRAGGPVDLIRTGETGTLIDAPVFAQELHRTVEWVFEPERYAHMRAGVRAEVENRTWPALCDQLFAHYEAVRAKASQPAV